MGLCKRTFQTPLGESLSLFRLCQSVEADSAEVTDSESRYSPI